MVTSIRVKFSRKGPVKYLGHLDMMRYFQKVLMRANLDVRYSEGFNPHQIMSFAYPLGVSMETEGDYMDFDVNSYTSTDDILVALNSVMHEGVKAESVTVVPEDALNAMASVAAASYRVKLGDVDYKSLVPVFDDFMALEEILLEKETKDKKKNRKKKKSDEETVKLVDIKPGLIEVKVLKDEVYMFLKSGSELNIKPLYVINALNNYAMNNGLLNKELSITANTRVDIYKYNSDNKLVPLNE